MGTKLAIKGHTTRGKEVIELLEMLGGKNVEGFIGTDFDELYTIEDGCIIQAYDWNHCVCFTLEEFLEKYPYKIGDLKDREVDSKSCIIDKMRWNSNKECIEYHGSFGENDYGWHRSEDFRIYDPLPNIFSQKFKTAEISFNEKVCKPEVELKLGNYEIETRDGKTYAVLKKPKYPTTYEECWKVRFEVDGETTLEEFHNVRGYYSEPLGALQKLLCCRDAYWKIAGEEMGLGKPWKPDWTTSGQDRYTIETNYDIFRLSKTQYGYRVILVFPTAEMRNTFYENFKELLEACKELL